MRTSALEAMRLLAEFEPRLVGALLSVPILLTLTALFHHTGRPNLLGFLFGEPLFPTPSEDDQSAS